MKNKNLLLFAIAISLSSIAHAQEPDTLPPLQDGKAPQNLVELWAGFDPQKEPLDTEVLKEWEGDGNVYRIVRFRVGVFKGKKSMLEAIYGFPKGATKLPALLQVHGGGQHAELAVCRMDAGRGYASLSINWGGNPLGLDQMTFDGPNTDWGALDATHPPQHNLKMNHYIEGAGLLPDEYTIDSVKSPRNSNWFVVLMGVRRAITFLEQQPEVDPNRIGVYGHSMGGKLTTDVAGIDPRIKAAAPSCGGAGDIEASQTDLAGCVKNAVDPMALSCDSDNAYIPGIKCPILLNLPSNDFNTPFDNVFYNWRNLPDETTRFSVSPHMNHRQIPECAITRYLWMDQNLKHGFNMPKTPQVLVDLKTQNGIPMATVTPDTAQPVPKVDVYYSIDPHVLSRFWRHADAVQNGVTWQAPLPILSTNQPLFVFANVTYPLPDSYQASDKIKDYTFSSREVSETSDELKAAGVKATDTPSAMIDDGTHDWQDWYRIEWFNPYFWTCYTRKLKDPKWRGPDGAKLVFDVLSNGTNSFVITAITNEWGAFPGKPNGTYSVRKELNGTSWQTVSLSVDDLIPAANNPNGKLPPLANWQTITQLCLSQNAQDGTPRNPGDPIWQGGPFAFRNLHWEGGTVTANSMAPDAALSPEALQKGFNDGIKKSLEQEKLDKH